MEIRKNTKSGYKKFTPRKSKNNQPEYHLQVAICNYLAIKYSDVFFNGSAGGMRTFYSVAKKMKATGYKAGFPDIFIYEPKICEGQIYHGLAIELKVKGNYASQKQKRVIEKLNKKGYMAKVCTGFDEAVDTIDNYLNY